MRDSQDPDLARNLASLGQALVAGKGQPSRAFRTVRPSLLLSFKSPGAHSLAAAASPQDNPMLGILAERQRADEALEASPSSRIENHISAASLFNLLDERKQCTSQGELDELAREYGMDPKVIDQLARHINSPSESEIPLPSSDPNEPPKRLVRPLLLSAGALDLTPARPSRDRPSGSTRSSLGSRGCRHERAPVCGKLDTVPQRRTVALRNPILVSPCRACFERTSRRRLSLPVLRLPS